MYNLKMIKTNYLANFLAKNTNGFSQNVTNVIELIQTIYLYLS